MDTPISKVADAVRRSVESPQQVHPSQAELQEFVDAELFSAGSLAPPAVIMTRAIARIGDWVASERRSDQPLVKRFSQAITTEYLRFVEDPSSALSSDCASHTRGMANCFGIDESMVPRIFQAFAGMTLAQRVGVFLHIEDSATFRYLARQIDSAPGSVPFDDPEGSFRALLRLVHEA